MERFIIISIELLVLAILGGIWLRLKESYKHEGAAITCGILCIGGMVAFVITGLTITIDKEYTSYKEYKFEVVDGYGCLSFRNKMHVVHDMREIKHLSDRKPIIIINEWSIFNTHAEYGPYYQEIHNHEIILTPATEEADIRVEELIK